MMPGYSMRIVRRRTLLALTLLGVGVLLYNALFSYSYSVGPNYRNVSVDTRVNITNAAPIITQVTLPDPVVLTAGGLSVVECNVTVMDYNGATDINVTNATLYHSSSSSGAADDNNTHYSNASCGAVSQAGNYKNFTCNFSVYYYALNGTWTCNASANDSMSYNATNLNTTTFSPVLALNVTPLIDYGNLSVGDTSAEQTANVTNIGNVPINVSVLGYGNASGDGLAFVCQIGNITVANEKFTINASVAYAQKFALSSSLQGINLTIAKQANATQQTNTTYWQLYVPPNPFGLCNGTVVFQADAA